MIVFSWTEYNKTQAGMYPTGILSDLIWLKKTKKKKPNKHCKECFTLKEDWIQSKSKQNIWKYLFTSSHTHQAQVRYPPSKEKSWIAAKMIAHFSCEHTLGTLSNFAFAYFPSFYCCANVTKPHTMLIIDFSHIYGHHKHCDSPLHTPTALLCNN